MAEKTFEDFLNGKAGIALFTAAEMGKYGDFMAIIQGVVSAHEAGIARAVEAARQITADTSDGYHTFNELYEFRKLYNAALFNEWASQHKFSPHKSWKHSDGEDCFGGGWFVVCAHLPTGQITNHYEAGDWELFNIPESPRMDVWDGHTPQDVAERLSALLTNPQETQS